ncbi:MAG: aminodeoxychorismate/anthranilate synthase component II [Planctomycetota bacterium]
MILVIDNYDSFTFNLVQLLGCLGQESVVVRNDSRTVPECLALGAQALVVSPGPGTPAQAGISNDLILRMDGHVPVLGVCLGHQCLATVFGATVGRALHPCHGQVRPLLHQGTGLFAGIPTPCDVALYHSLMVLEETLPPPLEVTARTEDGTIMALAARDRPTFGIQFHPESFLTPSGEHLISNFLSYIEQCQTTSPTA